MGTESACMFSCVWGDKGEEGERGKEGHTADHGLRAQDAAHGQAHTCFGCAVGGAEAGEADCDCAAEGGEEGLYCVGELCCMG